MFIPAVEKPVVSNVYKVVSVYRHPRYGFRYYSYIRPFLMFEPNDAVMITRYTLGQYTKPEVGKVFCYTQPPTRIVNLLDRMSNLVLFEATAKNVARVELPTAVEWCDIARTSVIRLFWKKYLERKELPKGVLIGGVSWQPYRSPTRIADSIKLVRPILYSKNFEPRRETSYCYQDYTKYPETGYKDE